jgi:hypothetical protein
MGGEMEVGSWNYGSRSFRVKYIRFGQLRAKIGKRKTTRTIKKNQNASIYTKPDLYIYHTLSIWLRQPGERGLSHEHHSRSCPQGVLDIVSTVIYSKIVWDATYQRGRK